MPRSPHAVFAHQQRVWITGCFLQTEIFPCLTSCKWPVPSCAQRADSKRCMCLGKRQNFCFLSTHLQQEMNTVVESISTYLILGPRSVLSSLRWTEDELTSAEIKGNCHTQRPLCKSHFCAQGQVSWAKAAVCSCAAPHSPQHNPSSLSISYLSQQQPDVSFKIYYTGSFPKDADYCSGRTCGAGSTQAGSTAPLPHQVMTFVETSWRS